MALPIYPASDLEQPRRVLATLGSLWTDTYGGNDLVQSIVGARADLELQTFQNMQELVDCESWETVPIHHTEHRYWLRLLESERNTQPLAKYDDGEHTYGDGLLYDTPPGRTVSIWPAPEGLADVSLITNRIQDPSVVLVRNLDFRLRDDGFLEFRENPFDNALVAKRTIFEGAEAVDREAALWLFRGQFDRGFIYEHYGYLLARRLDSSEAYREFCAGLLDALIKGTAYKHVQRVVAAIADSPLAHGDETVERIEQDSRGLVVVTDQQVYRYPENATALVAVGDVVTTGDPLVNTLEIFEFNRGQLYTAEQLPELVLGPGLLGHGYRSDLVFRNESVPLEVTTENGKTRVQFELGGFAEDVTQFWDTVHARGVARDETLADLLDSRTNPTTEPTAPNLPAELNPMQFLTTNLWRHHVFVVKLRTDQFGPNRLGTGWLELARRIVPPHTLMVVLIVLGSVEEPVTMDGAGDESSPGGTDDATFSVVLSFSDSISSENLEEILYIRSVAPGCS